MGCGTPALVMIGGTATSAVSLNLENQRSNSIPHRGRLTKFASPLCKPTFKIVNKIVFIILIDFIDVKLD